jgi:hypothetical protein
MSRIFFSKSRVILSSDFSLFSSSSTPKYRQKAASLLYDPSSLKISHMMTPKIQAAIGSPSYKNIAKEQIILIQALVQCMMPCHRYRFFALRVKVG